MFVGRWFLPKWVVFTVAAVVLVVAVGAGYFLTGKLLAEPTPSALSPTGAPSQQTGPVSQPPSSSEPSAIPASEESSAAPAPSGSAAPSTVVPQGGDTTVPGSVMPSGDCSGAPKVVLNLTAGVATANPNQVTLPVGGSVLFEITADADASFAFPPTTVAGVLPAGSRSLCVPIPGTGNVNLSVNNADLVFMTLS